jgi:hypothetical protein
MVRTFKKEKGFKYVQILVNKQKGKNMNNERKNQGI